MMFGSLRRICRVALIALVLAGPVPCALAQSLLTEPDFSGMYLPGPPLGQNYWDERGTVIARDATRGWTYIVRSSYGDVHAFANGVRVGKLSRVHDSGQLDPGWSYDETLPQRSVVLANGDLLILTDSFYSPWQRLRRDASGVLRSEAFVWTRDLSVPTIGAPIARDAAGNFYVIVSRNTATALQASVRRISADGVPDLAWSLDIEVSPSSVRQLAIADDGSVFYMTSQLIDPFAGASQQTLSRTSIRTDDKQRWSRAVTGAIAAIAADALGRVYLLGAGLSVQAQRANLMRLDATGEVDLQWRPTLDAAASNDLAAMHVVKDQLLVAARRGALSDPFELALLSLTDAKTLTMRTLPAGATAIRMESDGTLITSDLTGLTLLTAARGELAERRVPLAMGSSPIIASVLRWRDGYVIGGQFDYWYDGVRYSKLMRLTAAMKPDASWRPVINGTVNALAVDRDGGLLVGGDKLINAQTSLLRFAANAANAEPDARWAGKRFDGPVAAVTVGTDGAVFAGGNFSTVDGIRRPSIARFDVTTASAELSLDWATSPPWVGQFALSSAGAGIQKIIDAGDGGVLVLWRNGSSSDFYPGPALNRLLRSGNGAAVPLSAPLVNASGTNTLTQDSATGRLYVVRYVIDPVTRRGSDRFMRLLPTTLEDDPLWTPLADSPMVVAFTDTYLFTVDGRRLTRQANAVALDAQWALGRNNIAGYVFTGSEAANPANASALAWHARGAPFAIRLNTQANETRTAVEYFAKNAQRFFVTARVAEQQQLDAMPTQFTRTGMQFTVFDGAVLPPTNTVIEAAGPQPAFSAAGAQPVCRFYAAPARGGSNTHFYGRGADCQFLNTSSRVVNEGYDFAALPAKNGICPANASQPVYRAFNNQVLSNNGNHRYVVSSARMAEMTARGWLDEGIAFCAISVTDSSAGW
jgi:Repeat of unknown function (DUF5648)